MQRAGLAGAGQAVGGRVQNTTPWGLPGPNEAPMPLAPRFAPAGGMDAGVRRFPACGEKPFVVWGKGPLDDCAVLRFLGVFGL